MQNMPVETDSRPDQGPPDPFLDPPTPLGPSLVIAVAARKGGVGKTTLAYELAAAWGAVLVDFDWDEGGATGMWGARLSSGLSAALEGGTAPRIRAAAGRPLLVPSSPELADGGWQPERVADALERWATTWSRPIVVDTHPGVGELAFGAMSAASLTAVPVVLRERELDALAGMLRDHPDHHLAIVPNMAPPVTPERQLRRLSELADGRPVSPPVSAYPWIGRRARRSALVLTPPAHRTARARDEFVDVARFLGRRLEGSTDGR